MTITRAIVSESTTPEKRSHAMANLVIAMTAGFASGSGIFTTNTNFKGIERYELLPIFLQCVLRK